MNCLSPLSAVSFCNKFCDGQAHLQQLVLSLVVARQGYPGASILGFFVLASTLDEEANCCREVIFALL